MFENKWQSIATLLKRVEHQYVYNYFTVVTIGFNQTTYMALEEDDFGRGSEVTICINLHGELDRNIIVTFSTINQTAIGRCCCHSLKLIIILS